jgi:hypothetical protein
MECLGTSSRLNHSLHPTVRRNISDRTVYELIIQQQNILFQTLLNIKLPTLNNNPNSDLHAEN